MRIVSLNLERFRNINFSALRLTPDLNFLVGNNGVGKTNLLEALNLVTALRSFRTTSRTALIQWEKPDTALFFRIDSEKNGPIEVTLRFSRKKREIFVDGQPVRRFGDFVGQFPTVVLCSQDIQLLRGSPSYRRRFMDLLFASSDHEYLDLLRRYHKALMERNSLLKRSVSRAELRAFESIMAPAAVALMSKRKTGFDELGRFLKLTYERFTESDEAPSLEYRADVVDLNVDQYEAFLESQRKRDTILQSSGRGPHRDDFSLEVFSRKASDFGSEGQQRGLAIALRLAQADYFRKCTGETPVILADDILGELDDSRRSAFWSAIDPAMQIIATGTRLPAEFKDEKKAWSVWTVKDGGFYAC